MSFLKRLSYYLIGVVLGTFVVMFLFGDRDMGCSYFPNDRVLSDLRKKELHIPETIVGQLKEAGLDTSVVTSMLRQGDVDFDQVERGLDSCKTYWINMETEKGNELSALFENCDSTATILELVY